MVASASSADGDERPPSDPSDGPEVAPAMLEVTPSCRIPLGELRWRFGPSGGPGGQHANRAHTRAEVRFDVAGSASLTEGQRARLTARLGPVVVVSSDVHRSQTRNRAEALDRLRQRLAAALATRRPRRASRVPPGAKQRRLDAKRRQAERKSSRRWRPGDD